MGRTRWGELFVATATVGDYITTVVGLSTGTMQEANPTAVAFMDALGVVSGFALLSLIGMAATIGMVYAVRKQSWIPRKLAVANVVGTYSAIKLFATFWNANLILSVA